MVRPAGKIALLIFGSLFFVFAITILIANRLNIESVGLFYFGIITFVSYPGALIIYIVHVYRNRNIDNGQKHLWAALLFFGNIFVYPFYWYLHIWRKPKTITT